jgi:hypothetical protein
MANPIFNQNQKAAAAPQSNNQMNQMMQLFNQFKNMNPNDAINLMIKQNPQMSQILNNINPNDPNAMEQICKGICQKNGIDYNMAMNTFKNMMNKQSEVQGLF